MSTRRRVLTLVCLFKANWAVSSDLYCCFLWSDSFSHDDTVLHECAGNTDLMYLQQSCLYNITLVDQCISVLFVSVGSWTVCTTKVKGTDILFPFKLTIQEEGSNMLYQYISYFHNGLLLWIYKICFSHELNVWYFGSWLIAEEESDTASGVRDQASGKQTPKFTVLISNRK